VISISNAADQHTDLCTTTLSIASLHVRLYSSTSVLQQSAVTTPLVASAGLQRKLFQTVMEPEDASFRYLQLKDAFRRMVVLGAQCIDKQVRQAHPAAAGTRLPRGQAP
jgi:hypothetical protein